MYDNLKVSIKKPPLDTPVTEDHFYIFWNDN